MNREELSELVTGKVIEGTLGVAAVNFADLLYPYDEVIKRIQKAKGGAMDTDIMAEIVQEIGYLPLERAQNAAQNVNGLPIDWPELLRRSAIADDVGQTLNRLSKKLQKGDRVDPAELMTEVHRLDVNKRRVVSADKVTPEHAPFQETFYLPIDTFVGGIPKAALTVIGAPPGTGKTSFLLKLAEKAAKNGKKCMLFSMEMTAGQLLQRMLDLSPLTPAERANILICEDILKPAQVASVATLVPDDIYFIGVDFAELMLSGKGDNSESAMAEIYQTLVYTAKTLNIPIVLLSQLSRAYQGGLPQITHLRYTGMAEALASLILLLYNPNAIFVNQDSGGALPKQAGKGYVIVGKTRYGHKATNQATGRFAIQIDWGGKTGWGEVPPPKIHPL